MAEDNNNLNNNADDQQTTNTTPPVGTTPPATATPPATPPQDDIVERVVADRLDKKLAPLKEKLDKAFEARDKALAELAELKQKERDREIAELEKQGKHQEAFEARLAQERAEKEALRLRNIELSRDVAVREALRSMQFRNEKAADMAFREITSNLVQNEQGVWVHRSGVSIRDYCDQFAKDEDQAFLFKAKANNGAGTGTAVTTGVPSTTANGRKSLFSMPQSEVIALAAKGQLPNQRK